MLYLVALDDGIIGIHEPEDDTFDLDTLATGLELEGVPFERPVPDTIEVDSTYADMSDLIELCETLYLEFDAPDEN